MWSTIAKKNMIISTRCAIQSTDVKHKENKMKTYIMACVLVVAAASYNSAMAKCDQTYIDCYDKCLLDKKCQSEKNKYQVDGCGAGCMYDCEEYRTCLK